MNNIARFITLIDTETLPADKVFFYTGVETCPQSGKITQLGKLSSRC